MRFDRFQLVIAWRYCMACALMLLASCASSPEQPQAEPEAPEPAEAAEANVDRVPVEIIEQVELLRLLPPPAPPTPLPTPEPQPEVETEAEANLNSQEQQQETASVEQAEAAQLQAEVTIAEPATPITSLIDNDAFEQTLSAAEAALARSDYLELSAQLAELEGQAPFSREQDVRLRLLSARLALANNDLAGASANLDLNAQALRAVPRALQIDWFGLRADYYRQSGDSALALRIRIELDRRLQTAERLGNQRALVNLLASFDLPTLTGLGEQAKVNQNRGWYELGKALVSNRDSLVLRSIALNRWREDWVGHPANANLERLVAMESPSGGRVIENIGVILPLSGTLAPLGEAVQTGINLASSDYVFQTGRVAPQISYYDSASAGVTDLYDQASAAGAQLIIGPLLKPELAALNSHRLAVPVLGLNYLDAGSNQSRLFQLALAVQDEISFVARSAWNSGCLNALLLYSDAEWARNAQASFRARWNQLGGVVLDEARINSDANLARIISRLVRVSDEQVEKAKSYFNRELNASEYEEFQALGRRNDAECLFLFAPDNQARLIRPLLAFYLANDLATYASSHIHKPANSRQQNRDLDGIYWGDLPWFSQGGSTRQRLQREPSYASLRPYERLVALGVDAFNIYPYLSQLRVNPDLTLEAATGTLQLNDSQQLEREPLLMRFIDGNLVLAE